MATSPWRRAKCRRRRANQRTAHLVSITGQGESSVQVEFQFPRARVDLHFEFRVLSVVFIEEDPHVLGQGRNLACHDRLLLLSRGRPHLDPYLVLADHGTVLVTVVMDLEPTLFVGFGPTLPPLLGQE